MGGIYLSYFGVRFSSFPHWESTDETNFGFSSQSNAILRINFTCTKVGVNDNLAVVKLVRTTPYPLVNFTSLLKKLYRSLLINSVTTKLFHFYNFGQDLCAAKQSS